MLVLGLDLSITSTGYAVINKVNNEIKVIDYGKIMTDSKNFKKNEEDLRINLIVDEISNILSKHDDIELIGIENQFVSCRTNTIMVLRKLLGAVCRMAYKEYNTHIEYRSPMAIKKFITGTGKAKKDEVAKIIQKEYIDIGEFTDKSGMKKTSDIYDAIGVAITVIG